MINIRKSQDRGHTRIEWLDSYHTFSFDRYYDPDYVNFGHLRVLNEDRIAPAQGFGTHPHRDMEIFSFIASGSMKHKDSAGNEAVMHPGRVQLMSAGTGIFHSEFNPSGTEPTHLLQVWIVPNARNLKPGYQELDFEDRERKNRLKLLASPGGDEGSMTIHQDARIYTGLLEEGQSLQLPLTAEDTGWLQLVRGALDINGEHLEAGDGAAITGEATPTLTSAQDAEFLLFKM